MESMHNQTNLHRDHRFAIGVLMGGMSIEREVSFNSGRTICDHLDAARFRIVPIFQTAAGKLYLLPLRFLHRGKTTDFEHRLPNEAQSIVWDDLPQLIDFMFIAMHGRYAEDGTIQGMLEVLRIPYFGSKVYASALGMDKVMQKKILAAEGIAVPRSRVYSVADIQHMNVMSVDEKEQMWDAIVHDIGAPCIIKPVCEGSSYGVTHVHTAEEMCNAMMHAATITPGIVQPVICEEFVTGMEFSCIVIPDPATGELLAMPPTEIALEDAQTIFDYVQKYMPGRGIKYTPARCSDDHLHAIQNTSVNVVKALHMHTLGRIDGFLRNDGTVVIIDPNTLSGMAPASFIFLQAAQIGMSHTQLMNHLLDAELRAYNMITSLSSGKTMEANHQRIRVAVLLGGASAEREISLESGRNIVYKLSPHKYEAIPLFVDERHQLYKLSQAVLVKNRTSEIAAAVSECDRVLWSDLPRLADFVFIGLHGGKGEDGSVQGSLELLGLPYNGSSVLASAMCMDKHATAQFLKSQNFDVPRSIFLSSEQWKSGIDVMALLHEHQLSFPLIVKPHDDGCSVHVYKVNNQHDIEHALSRICSERSHVLIEELVSGMELTVGVLGNEHPQVLPPSYAVATGGVLSIEEKFLPGAGENQTPAPLPAESISFVQSTIRAVYEAIGCRGYARIDCFYQSPEQSPTGHKRLVILEINSLPGLTPATCFFHQAAEIGMSPMDVIDRIVQYGIEAHQASRNVDIMLPANITETLAEV